MIITGTNLIVGKLDISSLERIQEHNPIEAVPFRIAIKANQSIEADDKFYTLQNIQSALKAGLITISDYDQQDVFNEEIAVAESFTTNFNLTKVNILNRADFPQEEFAKMNANMDIIDANMGGGGGTSDHAALTNLDYVSSGHTGFLPDSHLSDFNHSDITHTNRTALNNVSGINTGDQDLSNYLQNGANVSSLVNDSGYLTNETDPDFNAWLGATPPLYSESDPLSLHLDQTAPQSVINGAPQFKGIQFDTNTVATPLPYSMGLMQWNKNELTVDINLADDSVLQVGQETLYRVKNQTGSTLTDGTAVMFAGSLGNSGIFLCQPMIGNGTYPSDYFMGVVTHDILDGEDGYVTHFGKVRNINTTGADVGETWNDGDILYLSPTTAGKLTKNRPSAPNNSITVCAVIHAHNNGTLFVRPTWECKLADLQDVDGTPLATDGQILVWNNTSSVFDFDYNINDYLLESDASNIYATVTDFNNHTGDSIVHFTEASINHNNILNVGTNSHTQIDQDLTRLANTSGLNTGDQDLSSYLQSGDNVSSLVNDSGYLTSSSLTGYALLDGSNQPFTGDIEISKANPKIIATDTASDTPSVWLEKLTTLDGSQLVSQNRVFIPINAAQMTRGFSITPVNVSDFTFSVWFKCSSAATQQYFMVATGLVYTISATGIRVASFGGSTQTYTVPDFTDGNWHHLVLVRSGANATFYFDGISYGTANIGSTSASLTWFGGPNSGYASTFTYDECLVWPSAKDATFVSGLYSSGNPTQITDYTGITGAWHFNSTSGSTAVDSSGNGRNGTFSVAPTWVTGKVANSTPAALSDIPITKMVNNSTTSSYGTLTNGYYSGSYGTSNVYDGLTHSFRVLGTTRAAITGSTLAVTGNITATTSIGATTTLSAGTTIAAGTTVSAGTYFRGSAGAVGTPTYSFTSDTNSGIYSGGSDIVRIATAGTDRVSIIANGNVGLRNTAPGYTLDIQDGGIGLLLGADSSAFTRTNAVAKLARLAVPHYTNAEEPTAVFVINNGLTTNTLSIGGGTGLCNAATDIAFYTAANNTTVTGTIRMSINSSGKVGMFGDLRVDGLVGIGTTAPDKQLEINSADGNNLRLTYNDADGTAANYVDLLTTSSGDLTITPSGGDVSLGSANLETTGALKGVHKAADGTSSVADGTYNLYNDGVTSGQVTSLTIKDGIITAIAQIP